MKIIKFIFKVFAFIFVNIAFLSLIFFLIMGIFDFFINYIPSFIVNIVDILSSDNFQTSLWVYFKVWQYILYFEKIKESYNFLYDDKQVKKENEKN